MPNPAVPGAPTRVVIDTNVLLALWLFADPEVAALRGALESGALLALRSPATDAEVADVLARPGLFDVPPARQADLLAAWQGLALAVADIAPAPCRCRDRDDQKFLDLAVTAGARWLVTRDKALLKLDRRLRSKGLAITTPLGYAQAAADGATA